MRLRADPTHRGPDARVVMVVVVVIVMMMVVIVIVMMMVVVVPVVMVVMMMVPGELDALVLSGRRGPGSGIERGQDRRRIGHRLEQFRD